MSERELRPWRVISSTYPIASAHLRLRADRVELPTGEIIDDYYVRESRGFCVVFAMTEDERVVLVRQYKHGIREIIIELPAGGIDADETPEACAHRELAEETGYTVERLEHLRTFPVDPTSASGSFHLFLGRGARLTTEQSLDVTEEIDVSTVPLNEIRQMAFDGRIRPSSQVAAILVALEALKG